MASITAYLTHLLEQSESTFHHLGILGLLLYAVGCAVLQMLFIPLSPFGLLAGEMFGFWKALFAITIGTNVGATINFLLARYIARDAITRRLQGNEKFRVIDQAVGREGWKIIVMLRLCPLPFGLANYCYGLTAIRFWPYFIATFFAIIPANCLFIWIGASAKTLAASGPHGGDTGKKVLLAIGIVSAFFALRYITKLAKAAVENARPEVKDAA